MTPEQEQAMSACMKSADALLAYFGFTEDKDKFIAFVTTAMQVAQRAGMTKDNVVRVITDAWDGVRERTANV